MNTLQRIGISNYWIKRERNECRKHVQQFEKFWHFHETYARESNFFSVQVLSAAPLSFVATASLWHPPSINDFRSSFKKKRKKGEIYITSLTQLISYLPTKFFRKEKASFITIAKPGNITEIVGSCYASPQL